MAIGDIYLQIDGIKGESQDDTHKDWMELLGAHWGIYQPSSATASASGGHTAERAELEEICFSKLVDLASPILAQRCAMGKTIPKARLEFFRADGGGTRVKYFEIELENVLISMVKPHIGGDDSYLVEMVNLKYSQIRWRYTQQKIGGGTGGNTVGGWNLAANRTA
jgi:type VI secretion system secreted protein Hcp